MTVKKVDRQLADSGVPQRPQHVPVRPFDIYSPEESVTEALTRTDVLFRCQSPRIAFKYCFVSVTLVRTELRPRFAHALRLPVSCLFYRYVHCRHWALPFLRYAF
jgi:hypothetical protein